MDVRDIVIEVRNAAFGRVGVIPSWEIELNLTVSFNAPGPFTLSVPSGHAMVPELCKLGAGIVVNIPNVDPVGCLVDKVVHESTPDDPEGISTFVGNTDEILLWRTILYPDPVNSAGQQKKSHWKFTGTAGEALSRAVYYNCGAGARTGRVNTHLTVDMADNSLLGDSISVSERFPKLGEFCQANAAANGIGFRLIQDGTHLRFRCYPIERLNKWIRLAEQPGTKVRFDVLTGNLSSSTMTATMPSATRAIVAGSGGLLQRIIREVGTTESAETEAALGYRTEVFVDRRDTSDRAALDRNGRDALAGASVLTVSCEAKPSDDMASVYGVDWKVGDIVAVVVQRVEYLSRVTSAIFKVGKQGLAVGAVLGDPGAVRDTSAMRSTVASSQARTSALERSCGTPSEWVNMNLPSGWTNYGGSTAPAAFRLLADDGIALRGTVAGSGTGLIFTMPEELRPEKDEYFQVDCNGGTGRVDVKASTGEVILQALYGSATASRVSLAGIRYYLD